MVTPLRTTAISASTKGWIWILSPLESASFLGGPGRSRLKGGNPLEAFRQAMSWQLNQVDCQFLTDSDNWRGGSYSLFSSGNLNPRRAGGDGSYRATG